MYNTYDMDLVFYSCYFGGVFSYFKSVLSLRSYLFFSLIFFDHVVPNAVPVNKLLWIYTLVVRMIDDP